LDAVGASQSTRAAFLGILVDVECVSVLRLVDGSPEEQRASFAAVLLWIFLIRPHSGGNRRRSQTTAIAGLFGLRRCSSNDREVLGISDGRRLADVLRRHRSSPRLHHVFRLEFSQSMATQANSAVDDDNHIRLLD